tara:strand:+ start:379 stop:1269 length:891 start_codon:yes stop_codon:yes gene_type:complete
MSVYTIDQLSRISGFNKILIRTWENRYNLFHPQRTKTNIRLYEDDCLIRALNIGILRDRGYKISHISKLNDNEIKSLVSNQDKFIPSNIVEYTNKIIESGITFNECLFNEYVHKAVAEFGLIHVYNSIILPTLEKIGVLWLTNNIMPSQEHFISELVKQTIVSNISLDDKPLDSAKSWLVFLPENEHHEIGLLLAKYILKESNQKVIYLGQSVPKESLAIVRHHKKIDNILFSAVTRESQRTIDILIDFLRELYPHSNIYCITHKSNIKDDLSKEVNYITSIEQFTSVLGNSKLLK